VLLRDYFQTVCFQQHKLEFSYHWQKNSFKIQRGIIYFVLSRDRVTIDGVWISNRIYWTLKQHVTTLYESLSHKD
jgi:hypothetical protein